MRIVNLLMAIFTLSESKYAPRVENFSSLTRYNEKKIQFLFSFIAL